MLTKFKGISFYPRVRSDGLLSHSSILLVPSCENSLPHTHLHPAFISFVSAVFYIMKLKKERGNK